MDPELERMYRNRASLPPAERRAVEAAYELALQQNTADYWSGTPTPPPKPSRTASASWGDDKAPRSDSQSRTDGAPAGDIGVEPEAGTGKKPRQRKSAPPQNNTAYGNAAREMAQFTRDAVKNARPNMPPETLSEDERDLEAYRADAETEASAYRDGFVNPQPGTEAWDAQGRNMDRSAGMREADVAQRDRQRKYNERAYELMEEGQMNPGQPLDLGTAEDQAAWDNWVRSSPDRMERYDPQGFAERQAAEDEKRYDRIAEQYGPGEAAAVRAAAMNGTVYLPQDSAARGRLAVRRTNESLARGAGPVADGARQALRDQDTRQAESNKGFRQKSADAAKKRQAEREADPRYQAWRSQMMLSGGQPTRAQKASINALNALPAGERAQALQFIAAGGRGATPLDVQAANAVQAVRALQGGQLGQGVMNPIQQQIGQNQIEQQNAQQRQEELSWLDDHVTANYADPQGVFNYLTRGAAWLGIPVHDNTEFTVAEQDQAIADLLARYPHLTYEQASQMVASVGRRRTTEARPAPAGQ